MKHEQGGIPWSASLFDGFSKNKKTHVKVTASDRSPKGTARFPVSDVFVVVVVVVFVLIDEPCGFFSSRSGLRVPNVGLLESYANAELSPNFHTTPPKLSSGGDAGVCFNRDGCRWQIVQGRSFGLIRGKMAFYRGKKWRKASPLVLLG